MTDQKTKNPLKNNNERSLALARGLGIEVNTILPNPRFQHFGGWYAFDPFNPHLPDWQQAIMEAVLRKAVLDKGYSVDQNTGSIEGNPFAMVYIHNEEGDMAGCSEDEDEPLLALALAAEQLPEVQEATNGKTNSEA